MGRAEASSPSASDSADATDTLVIELFWTPERGVLRQQSMRLPGGSTLGQALLGSGWFAAESLGALAVGIWGRQQPLETLLRDGDRVEVYRPLTVDPKEARRQRYQATGKRIVTRHRPLGRKA